MSEHHIRHPTVAELKQIPLPIWETAYKPHLQYIDFAIQSALNRHVQNYQWKNTDSTGWQTKKEQLEHQRIKPLYVITTTQENHDMLDVVCRPGSLHLLPPSAKTRNSVTYPSLQPGHYIWKNNFPFTLHEYQHHAVTHLLEHRHAHVEMTTGVGKAAIILELVRQSGLRCAVIVPGKENFKALSAEFKHYFGADIIGQFGDGQKRLNRPITICVGKSLSLLTKATTPDAYAFFSQMDAIIVDESHTWGADTMSKVCAGLFCRVPYRFFLSATQVRSDEEDNLLFSIIGPCVYTLGTAEAVKKGYICHHTFEIYSNVPAIKTTEEANALADACRDAPMTVRRIAFLYNETIADIIVQRALCDFDGGKASLILVDEVGQLGLLMNVIKRIRPSFNAASHIAFAHGETNTTRLQSLHLPTNKASSMERAVLDMNQGKKLIMMATSCVQTGASFFTPHTCYNFVGGGAKNRVRTLQGAVGRAVRKWTSNPFLTSLPSTLQPKTSAVVVDFDVDQPQMKKHLQKRLSYYKLSGTAITFV